MRVLVIDDDVGTCETLKAGLTRLGGHAVVCAQDAGSGIAAMRGSRFDAGLIDLWLANGVSGLSALRAFVQSQPSAAAYLLTAYAEPEAITEALSLGARYLPKLLDIEQLARVLGGEAVQGENDAVAAPDDVLRPPSSPLRHVALERWADLVVRGARGPEDPRTLDIWSRTAGVSRSALEMRHAAVKIAAHDAKDLTRLLWASRVSGITGSPLAELLDADPRTIDRIVAGLDPEQVVSPAAALEGQRLIADSQALKVLRRAFSKNTRD
jgi:ActR/RegA family two-component response regulator